MGKGGGLTRRYWSWEHNFTVQCYGEQLSNIHQKLGSTRKWLSSAHLKLGHTHKLLNRPRVTELVYSLG